MRICALALLASTLALGCGDDVAPRRRPAATARPRPAATARRAPTPPPPRPLAPAEKKESDFAEQRGERPKFSGWDGSCGECERYLMPQLNDPHSYEHVRTTGPTTEGAFWIVRMTYRAKNTLGALVLRRRRFYIQHREVAFSVDEL